MIHEHPNDKPYWQGLSSYSLHRMVTYQFMCEMAGKTAVELRILLVDNPQLSPRARHSIADQINKLAFEQAHYYQQIMINGRLYGN